MAIPEDHKEFFKGVVEKRLAECKGQVAKYHKSLRLLEKEKTPPLYIVAIHSYWKNDEEDLFFENWGTLQQAVHGAEKEFMEINHREDVQGEYAVVMKVGDVSHPLPKKMWSKFKKRK